MSYKIKNLVTQLSKIKCTSNFKNVNNILHNTIKYREEIDMYLKEKYKYSDIAFNEYGYSKNLIYKNNTLAAFYIVWNKGSKTNIHSHPSSGCFIMKLEGNWKETVYNSNNFILKYNNYNSGDISFINNQMGLHSVEYINKLDIGTSIHIYSPINEIKY